MKKLLLFLSIVAVLFVIPGQAKADVIFSDFTMPDHGYDTGAGWVVGDNYYRAAGEPFTPIGNSYTLTSITLAVAWQRGTNQLNAFIMNDNGGLPGTTVLDSLSLSGMNHYNYGTGGSLGDLVTGTSTLHPFLAVGTPYWLVVEPGDSTTWEYWYLNNASPTPFTSSLAYIWVSDDPDGTWHLPYSYRTAAFEIDGRPTNSATPEPATMLLFGIGGLGMALIKRVRKV